MAEYVDPNEPWVQAWSDQFGALIRDKATQMVRAIQVTGWDTCAHYFKDPADDSPWRLVYKDGGFYIMDLTKEMGEEDAIFQLDLVALGVIRR